MTKWKTVYGELEVPDDIHLDIHTDMADGFDTLCISVGRSFGKSQRQKSAEIERNKRLMRAGKIEFDEYEEIK